MVAFAPNLDGHQTSNAVLMKTQQNWEKAPIDFFIAVRCKVPSMEANGTNQMKYSVFHIRIMIGSIRVVLFCTRVRRTCVCIILTVQWYSLSLSHSFAH